MITHDGTITFTHSDGRIHSVLTTHSQYGRVKDLLRSMAGQPDDSPIRDQLLELAQPARLITRSTRGLVTVENNQVLYRGVPVRNVVAERILWMIGDGFDAAPMLAFLENVKENSSNRAVEELYRFMEAAKMGITRDGMILAYKRIRGDYRDIYTGEMDNSVGVTVEMPRNEVNDNPNETCSNGLHVCSMSYLPHYGAGPGNRVVICRIHPRDVVSVPIDYANAKMRVCRYTVIEEVTDQMQDVLASKPVFEHEEDADEAQWSWGDDDEELTEIEIDDTDEIDGIAEFFGDDEELEEAEELEQVLEVDNSAAPTEVKTPILDFTALVARVTQVVLDCAKDQLKVERIDPNHVLLDLGADDLDVIELVMLVEDVLNVELGDEWDADKTANHIIDAVLQQM
jgi:acyl carrier protein